MDFLNALQWPAMMVTTGAAWLIASTSKRKRNYGFWCFLISNALWIVWGWHTKAYGMIALQVALATLNIRGAVKTESA